MLNEISEPVAGAAKTILARAKSSRFQTLVVGRRGEGTTFFMGSVSRYILNKASQMAVWLVP